MNNSICPMPNSSSNGKFTERCVALQLAEIIINLLGRSPAAAQRVADCDDDCRLQVQIFEKVKELRHLLKLANDHTKCTSCGEGAQDEKNAENDMSLTFLQDHPEQLQDSNATQFSLEMDLTCENVNTLKTPNVQVRSILKSGQSVKSGDSARRVRFNDELHFEDAIWAEIAENKENLTGILDQDVDETDPVLHSQAMVNYSGKSSRWQGDTMDSWDQMKKSEENFPPSGLHPNDLLSKTIGGERQKCLKMRDPRLAVNLPPRIVRVECKEIDGIVNSEQNVLNNEQNGSNLKELTSPKNFKVDNVRQAWMAKPDLGPPMALDVA